MESQPVPTTDGAAPEVLAPPEVTPLPVPETRPRPRRAGRAPSYALDLLIVRHGPAGDRDEWAKSGKDDDERPLTPRGTREMRRAAKGLRKLVGAIDAIGTSPRDGGDLGEGLRCLARRGARDRRRRPAGHSALGPERRGGHGEEASWPTGDDRDCWARAGLERRDLLAADRSCDGRAMDRNEKRGSVPPDIHESPEATRGDTPLAADAIATGTTRTLMD